MDNFKFRELNEVALLAMLIYGEARGESYEGQCAVAHVVMNRLKTQRYGKTLKDVILRPLQFSCFNAGDANQPKLEKMARDIQNIDNDTFLPESVVELFSFLDIAHKVINGIIKDNTFGATHYFNPKAADPKWAKKIPKTATIGNHEFYRE